MNRIAALLTVTVLLAGTAAAQPADVPAPGLVPGDLFYGLEQFSERLELAVASAPIIGSDELAAKVRANNAAERLAEARKLVEQNRTEKVGELMQQYQHSLNRSVALARSSSNPELADRLKNVSRNHVEVLKQVRERVPPAARKGIENAINASQRNQRELDLPPQARRPGKRTPGSDINVTVDDRAPGKNGDRIPVGELPTGSPTGSFDEENPVEEGPEKPEALGNTGNPGGGLQ